MGRFYYGDICGKFWFACQPSDDATDLGGDMELMYRFYVCGCEYNFIEKLDDAQEVYNEDYCSSCFSSYKEHLEAVLDEKQCYEEDYGDDADTRKYKNLNNVWYWNEDEVFFQFDKNTHLPFIKESIETMEHQVGKYIGEFRFLEDSCRFEYQFDFSPLYHNKFDSIPHSKKQQTIEDKAKISFKKRIDGIIARYCLAKQIFHCLSEHGSCTFYAEV